MLLTPSSYELFINNEKIEGLTTLRVWTASRSKADNIQFPNLIYDPASYFEFTLTVTTPLKIDYAEQITLKLKFHGHAPIHLKGAAAGSLNLNSLSEPLFRYEIRAYRIPSTDPPLKQLYEELLAEKEKM